MKKYEKYETLLTKYAQDLNEGLPYPEYPRPQFVRDSYINLNGWWDFEFSESEDAPANYSKKILVPFPPESRLSGIEEIHSVGIRLYYKRKFTIPKEFVKDKVILHFGAVDQLCTVLVNGIEVGKHTGGYVPFFFDITEALNNEENEIVVKATDDLSHVYPYGKQRYDRGGMWYTPVSGIWQTVWLESVPEDCIERIKITANTTSAHIEIKAGVGKKKLTLKDSGEIYEFTDNEITLTPKNIRLWSPDDPYLYYFTLETDTDKVESYFALREISTGVCDGIPRILLNGKPYLFNGLLDQGYYPDGIFLPPTVEGYEDDIRLTKSLGYNTLRKHIKLEPMIFYHLCDKLGVVVFQDIINNSDYSFIRDTALPTIGMKRIPDKNLHKDMATREEFAREMKELMYTLYNSPSVLYYTVFNEGWGQFCADEMYRYAKTLDGTRIIDSTSGWFARQESDVDSRHVYFKRVKLGKVGERPIVISEFGGYSHRVTGHLFGSANYGYKSYEDIGEYESCVSALYKDEIKPLIKQGVSALIFTQISDVEDETNGLVTYDRKVVKINEENHRNLMRELEKEIL